MQDFVLRVYQREVARQCMAVVRSYSRLLHWTPIPYDESYGWVWYYLQNLVVSAANVSKLLWGATDRNPQVQQQREADRKQLRQSLGVANNSVLKLSPGFRNHFEHIDERIEAWAKALPKGVAINLLDDYIGPLSAVPPEVDPDNYFRSFDPTTWTIHFQGDSFEVTPVAEACRRLMEPAAESFAANVHKGVQRDGVPVWGPEPEDWGGQ